MTDVLVRSLLIGAAFVIVVGGLRAAAPLLLPPVVAMFLAIVMYPLVAWLRSYGVPTVLGVIATLITMMAALFGPGLVVTTATAQFAAAAPRYQARIRDVTEGSLGWLAEWGVDTSRWTTVADSGAVLDLIGSIFTGVAQIVSNAFIVLLVMAFMLMEAAGLPAKLAEAFSLRESAIERLSRVTRDVQRYLWYKTLISLATGVIIGLWTWSLGVDFAILWGLLAFLLNYIPNFGSILAAAPAVLLAVIQFGAGWAIVVGLGYVGVNIALGNITEPLLLGRRLQLSPLVILLSLVFWGWVWGPVGMLLAVPITMVVRILMENSPDFRWVAVLLTDAKVVAAQKLPAPADPAAPDADAGVGSRT